MASGVLIQLVKRGIASGCPTSPRLDTKQHWTAPSRIDGCPLSPRLDTKQHEAAPSRIDGCPLSPRLDTKQHWTAPSRMDGCPTSPRLDTKQHQAAPSTFGHTSTAYNLALLSFHLLPMCLGCSELGPANLGLGNTVYTWVINTEPI